MRVGSVRSGILVTDIMTAAEASARTIAKRYGKTAEPIFGHDGYLTNGGEVYRAEIWTHGRSRLAAVETFAIVSE
jgi:hypothetical protein